MGQQIVRPAAVVKQGNLTLYTTSLKVSDLLQPNFYSVETLDPDDSSDKGYQRLLNVARARKLSNYIKDGIETHDAFLPTSIFIATDQVIAFNPGDNTISFEIDKMGPFSVVDGQHRIEGLRMASEENSLVLDFEIPVNIATGLSKIAQMCHFLIVNTTQKSVDKAVEQRLYARLTKLLEVEDIPNLPKWISRAVHKGEDEKALQFVDFLNTEEDSPWKNKIEMANQAKNNATVTQKSFVKTIKQYVLTANNPISIQTDDKQHRIFLNYWKAVSNLLNADVPTVLFKYNGIQLFCRFSVPFFQKLHDAGDFKVSTMETLLRITFENIDGDNAGVGHSEWWNSGGKASYLNSGALNAINAERVRALHKSNLKKDIEI